MASPQQRAQRRLARDLREGRSPLPPQVKSAYKRGFKAAVQANADAIMRGDRPMPEKGSSEAKILAGLAGKARWGKAPSEYEAAFRHFWYHAREM